MAGQDIAYIRSSTEEQNTDRQFAESGINFTKIFEEKISGKTRERPQLEACLSYCREGDTLHAWSMDRLARNNIDLQNIVKELTGKGVKVHFHKEGIICSGEESPFANLIVQMFACFAEFERANIVERVREGVKAAKKKGVRFGKKPLAKEKVDAVRRLLKTQLYNVPEIVEKTGVGQTSVRKIKREWVAEEKAKLEKEASS